MRVDLDTGKYNVVISSSNFDVSIESGAKLDVNIGKSARIDVNSAVTYIKSGKKEIETYVEGKVKPDILEYSKVESQKFIDNYVPQTVEEYVDEVTKPSINEYTDTKISEFNQNAVSKLDDFNTLAESLTNEYTSLAQTSEETLIQYVDSASLSAKNAKDSADVSTAQASISTAQAVISTTKASESLASANASANSAKQCQAIKDSLGTVYVFKGSVANTSSLPANAKVGDVYDVQDSGNNYAWTGSSWDSLGVNVDLSNYALKSDLNSKQDKLTAGTGIKIENNIVSNTQTSAEWGNIKGTLSNQTDLQNALNNKVSKSGNEEISGNKTFKNDTFFNTRILINKTHTTTQAVYDNVITLTDSSLETNNIPYNKTYYPISFFDKNKKYISWIQSSHTTTGESGTGIFARTIREDGVQQTASITVSAKKDGVMAGYAPTPLLNAKSNEIATASWVRNTIKAEASAGRNIGDIFYTTRLDTELNGAVECNGGTYNTADFSGNQSIGNLLSQKKVPYVSLSEYESIVSTNGSCRAFGWDGGTSFRVPTIPALLLTKDEAAVIGNGSLGLTDGTIENSINLRGGGLISKSPIGSAVGYNPGTANYWSSDKTIGVVTDPTKSGIVANLDTIQYRAMVQLAIKTTDDAVITATSAIQQIANKVDKTSQTDIETVVGWGMPDYSAGVSKTAGVAYTAEVAGFVLYNVYGKTLANTLVINSVSMQLTTQAQYSHGVAIMMPVSKGDTYKVTGQVTIFNFYPNKGA